MTEPGPPTWVAHLTVAALAVTALGVGVFWMWTTATGLVYAGVPPWAVGLVVIGLLVALAAAVHRVLDRAP